MDNAWDELDAHSRALGQCMVEVGITKPAGSKQEMLRLNVGGAPVNIGRSALNGRGHVGNLFESVWDKRLPRDADGLVVLDHSPKCVKFVIHTLLNSSDADEATAKLASGDGVPGDQKVYFPYVVDALGLGRRFPLHVIGGSTVLNGDEFLPMASAILGWCRESRRGWS